METQSTNKINRSKQRLGGVMQTVVATSEEQVKEFNGLPHLFRPAWLDDLLCKLSPPSGKKSFLIANGNKYVNVLTENIALFYIRHESTMLLCFDKQSYFVNYSLDQIQCLLPENQFYRINRQCLINFSAVKDVEHYFARKLLVNSVIPTDDKLIISKEKVTDFLHWLDNR